MIRAVLIDDEQIALDVLEIVLGEAGGVTIAGKFGRASEALQRLPDLRPDLVFIDIEMPGMSGLAAAEKIGALLPQAEIIFVTAYEEYALKAFDVSAFDYLLKPVSKERLMKTMNRYRQRKGKLLPPPSGSLPPEREDDREQAAPASEPSLRLNVFGSMELYDSAGQLMTWRTKKTKEMFAYLWHHAGTPVTRHKIMDDLWPELSLDKAQSLFHTTLYQLRNTLKLAGFPDMVMFGDEKYWMRIERVVSDAGQLNVLLQRAQSQHVVDQLLALFRGDYLEMESYGWSEHDRYQIRSAFIRYLERWLANAEPSAKEVILQRLVKLEPYGEEHYRKLVAHLEERGEPAAAGRLRELMELRLQDELGPASAPGPN